MQTNIQILMAFAKNFQHKRFQFWGQQENTWIENIIFMDVSVHYLGQIHMHLAFLRTAFSKWFMNNMFSRIRTLTNTVCRPQLVEIKICLKQSHPPQNTVEEIHYLCPNENQIHEICSKFGWQQIVRIFTSRCWNWRSFNLLFIHVRMPVFPLHKLCWKLHTPWTF